MDKILRKYFANDFNPEAGVCQDFPYVPLIVDESRDISFSALMSSAVETSIAIFRSFNYLQIIV